MSSNVESRWDILSTVAGDQLPETIVSPIDNAEMVLVPGGPFTMGIGEEELKKISAMTERQTPIFVTEIPPRSVTLPPYYIDRYPVTNYQYLQFVESSGHRRPALLNDPIWGQPMHPVVFVGWDDARAYADWTGKSLPIEPQWEKAARGDDSRWWSWGHDFRPGRCNSKDEGLGRTSEIGLYDSGISPLGCYDMCGNVWEMCEGRWIENYPPMRGGCFLGSAAFVRTTCRWTPEDPVNGAHWLGFRCVKEIPNMS
jgi:formylglycine-generating enzyme required for sulfatase activity